MDIENLEALERAATGVQWKWYPPNDDDEIIIEFAGKNGEQDWGGLRVCPNGGSQRQCETDTQLAAAARNALPALLAVAKAAKLVKAANARRANAQVQDCCVREDYEQSMGHACDQLTRALEQLEATP